MANIIKKRLIALLDKFIANAPADKKANLQEIQNDIKDRVIPDTPKHFDKTAYDIFLITSGNKIVNEKTVKETHDYANDLKDFHPEEEKEEGPTPRR